MPDIDLEALRGELDALRASTDLDALPRACGPSLAQGVLRQAPADFTVIEHTGVEPRGAGEHLHVRVRKTGQNTRWLAKELARFAAIPYKSVSYAGLKDRHAVTEQTFSLHLPGQEDPDWSSLSVDGVEVLSATRHDRKLRQGQLSYNRFRIVVRDCAVADVSELEARCAVIATHGVPNYFGAQRFGRDVGNIGLVLQQTDLRRLPREQRSFAISALRSALFNGYLAARVADGSWSEALDGDALLSDRPRGAAEDDESLFVAERLPAGVLWGKSFGGSGGVVRARETEWFARFPQVCSALERAGSKMSRRVLRARLAEFRCEPQAGGLELSFAAGPGVFATVVLRELFALRDAALDYESGSSELKSGELGAQA
ncbi:MAG: tRNA pseudouridine(13) synthase TruD [Gammaproteobacteria bacterium]|nr:tRNA pseudouridine(13) synthase TruD [Gammaproteobacteria bacterium]